MRIRNAPLVWTPIILVALAVAPLVPRVLRACGPYFALEVLPTRTGDVLKPPVAPSVVDDLTPKPGDRLPVVFSDDPDERTQQMERAEREGLAADAGDRIKAMRALTDGEAAYAAGEGLPEAVRLYTAGAVCFKQRKLDQATHYFIGVLELKAGTAARDRRAVWASYMLGQIEWLQGNPHGGAEQYWQITRGLVRAGLHDPLGLAVASFGDEARLYLQEPRDIPRAVALYAKQAAYGSQSGQWSLLIIAEMVLKDPAQLEQVIDDPTTRRLVLRYLYANPNEETLDRVIDIFERHRASNVEGADLLAASTYAAGRFEAAAKLAAYEQTPLSAWIKAKLALRRGDRQAALASFAEAVNGMPAHQESRSQARAEVGILRVSSGEFAQAMELFYGAVEDNWSHWRQTTNYWGDLAYLAERVLTIDELLPVVDRLAPSPTRAALTNAKEHEHELPATKLRALVARRLMRAGRYREALRYFDDEHQRHVAEDYMKAVTKANNRWRSQGARAEAWFTAATIARHDGMDLLAFERDPDFAHYDGNFALEAVATDIDQRRGEEPVPDPRTAAAATVTGVTPDERARVEASKPPVPVRFHYRLTAADHALASAALIPKRSQAFAAVLCRATEWIIDREPQRAAQIYARYVHEGPLVPWATHFGRDCPAPDFASADQRRWQERLAMATWVFHRHPRRSAAAGAATLVLGTAWIVWRRRR